MLVPIACRFIPYDQWFVTHLDDKWRVKQIKHWILSKCNLVQSPGPQTHRSVSPITFAPTIRSSSSRDSLDDGYNEDDEYSDQDVPPHPPSKPTVDPLSSSPSLHPASSPLVDRYTLISFSTGSVLEDEFTLAWYNLRPYELLEMHPVGTVAPLQRDVLGEYIQPYFQAKVKVLRVVWNHRSGRFEAPGVEIQHEHGSYMAKDKLAHTLDSLSPKSSSFQSEKKRKTKVNWKARWVVINQGILSLCKEHVTSPPFRQFALSSMTALRGTDALERPFSVGTGTQPRVVCINFRPRTASLTGAASPPPSLPSSPTSEDMTSNVHEPLSHVDSASDLKQLTEQEDRRDKASEYAYDPFGSYGQGEWVILDMLDDHAFSSILRILHREASHPISSSFAPSSSIIAVSPHTSDATSFGSCDAIPYPEWRIHTVENARKAGMGDVGKPMAWVLWTEKGLGESLLGNIRHHRHAFLQEMQYKTTIPSDIYGTDDESDEESEMEWEGWMRDLERQCRVKQRLGKVCRPVARRPALVSSILTSQIPSPPPSEGSQYPKAHGFGCTELPYSPEKIRCATISTVSVGGAPSPRRRSSTVSAEVATTKRHEKSKHSWERFSGMSPHDSPRARTVNTSTGAPCSPKTPIRHAHSSSNLRIVSSPYDSDAGESLLHPVPPSPSKHQSAFLRGMSMRAGKIVRGLESAIDFVDEKTV